MLFENLFLKKYLQKLIHNDTFKAFFKRTFNHCMPLLVTYVRSRQTGLRRQQKHEIWNSEDRNSKFLNRLKIRNWVHRRRDAVLPENGQARRPGWILGPEEVIRVDPQGADAVGGEVPPQDGGRRRLPGLLFEFPVTLNYYVHSVWCIRDVWFGRLEASLIIFI